MVELLVVITIIGILSAMVSINYRSGQKQLALQRAANKLAQDIRSMQEMAMAAENKWSVCVTPSNFHYTFGLTVSTSSDCSNQEKPCKYRYILWTDCNGNNTYQWNPDEDFAVDLVDFSFVEVSSISGFSSDFAFQPPDPVMLIDGSLTSGTTASITIRLRDDPTKTKTISVNRAGLVEIQ